MYKAAVRTSLALITFLCLFVFTPSLVAPVDAAGKNYDGFAKCLAGKGAVMHGAFWCEHCKEQKELFGSSFQYVTYVECAVMGAPRQQTLACKNLAIKRYPTWIFSDNERKEGVVKMEYLAAKTGCKLP